MWVTAVEEAGRVRGRARIAPAFTSMRTGGTEYDIAPESASQVADATKGKDATLHQHDRREFVAVRGRTNDGAIDGLNRHVQI
jgi:hypothetical protein